MANQTHCPQCGATVTPDAPFCPRCGTDLMAHGASGNLPTATAAIGGSQPPPPPPAAPPVPPRAAGTGGFGQGNPNAYVQPGQSTRPWPFSSEVLAQQLAAAGFVAKPVVDALLAEATAAGRTLPEQLIESKQMAPEVLRDAMSRIFGLPIADFKHLAIDPQLVAHFPSAAARENVFLPLHREGTRLILVVWDPTKSDSIRAVRRSVGLTVDLRLATKSDLLPIVNQYFSPTLVIALPSRETLTIPIPHGELKIGKSDQNDIMLPDPTVSSTHAILRAFGEDYQIVDFGARNGVFVGGVRVNGSQLLKNGDVIQIGQCLLTFKLPIPEAAHSESGGTQILSPDQIRLPANLAAQRVSPNVVPVVGAVGVPAADAAAVPAKVDDDDDKKEKKKKKKKGSGGDEKLKAAWIGFVGRIVAQIVAVLFALFISLLATGKLGTACSAGSSTPDTPPEGTRVVTPITYGELNPKTNLEYNTSGIVQIADSKFLMVENNTNDALFELELTAEGAKTRPLERRTLAGLAPGSIDDMEGLTSVTENGQQYIFAVSSLMMKVKKKVNETPPSGLVRIVPDSYGQLKAENMTDFRSWVVQNCSEIGAAASIEPDDGGLNVEGLAWDPKRRALLLGVRTPVVGGTPLIVPIKVKDLAGPWTTANLEAMPAIKLQIEKGAEEQGIRDLQYDSSRSAFWVIVGNSTSLVKSPFKVYLWDGSDAGTARLAKGLYFASKMKPEGVTHATLGGVGAVVITDDAGGYQVLFDDDPRLEV
jgi:hypothetical protein